MKIILLGFEKQAWVMACSLFVAAKKDSRQSSNWRKGAEKRPIHSNVGEYDAERSSLQNKPPPVTASRKLKQSLEFFLKK